MKYISAVLSVFLMYLLGDISCLKEDDIYNALDELGNLLVIMKIGGDVTIHLIFTLGNF